MSAADEIADLPSGGADACDDVEKPRPLRAQLWQALAGQKRVVRPKEMKEACAFYDAVRRDIRKSCRRFEVVIDVCGGHGALGMLFVAHGAARRTLIIDQSKPLSHDALVKAWRPFLGDTTDANAVETVSYDERPLQEALPKALSANSDGRSGGVLVVACHACQHLSRQILDLCMASGVDFAVCPCCPKDTRGGIQAAAEALNVDFGSAMVLAEMGRLSESCDVRLRTFDKAISPQNRILVGRRQLSEGRFMLSDNTVSDSGLPAANTNGIANSNGVASKNAEERLRDAYKRAHRGPDFLPAARPSEGTHLLAASACTVKGNGSDSRSLPAGFDYECQLAKKMEAVATLFHPLTELTDEQRSSPEPPPRLNSALLVQPGLEVKRSPPQNFRARTIVSLPSPNESAAGNFSNGSDAGLFRLVATDKNDGSLQLSTNFPVSTLIKPIAAALPELPKLLGPGGAGASVRQGLRCVKFHATVGRSPAQLLAAFVYGPEVGIAGMEGALEDARIALERALAEVGEPSIVSLMAQARGAQICVPSGRDYVDEELVVEGNHTLRYRQPFGQFSNPNPFMAVHTAEWLLDVVRNAVNGGECSNSEAAPKTDLLELYCGAGSHTVALAPVFRHVLAVEINRHLVTAAQHNVAANGLSNVTVVRAPSEEFCKRVIKRRSYDLREGPNAGLHLSFGCTVVDPPRAGLDMLTLRAVQGYDHVLYISCNPEALRANLDVLLETHEVCRMVLLDHFPYSAHVETGVHLRRRGLSSGSSVQNAAAIEVR